MNQKTTGYVIISVFFATLLGISLIQGKPEVVPTSEELGRQVYISEGCIHCHSQYSRPDTLDIENWGPPSAVSGRSPGPVLIGNRRQGPDLSNVALRRPRDWNRRHLIAPATVTPGSRMPSYEYLFTGVDTVKGEALLDYLSSLAVEIPENHKTD